MHDSSALIARLVREHCTVEQQAVVMQATTTVPARVHELYAAELRGTPMCCQVHAAHSFYRICKRALEKPS